MHEVAELRREENRRRVHEKGTVGSKLADRMAKLKQSNSRFGGFLLPDAAVSFNFNQNLTADDIKRTVTVLAHFRGRLMEELEKDGELKGNDLTATKDVLAGLFDTLLKTIESGRMDGGAAVMLAPDAITVVAGGFVADGDALAQNLRKLANLAQNEPDFPGVSFFAEKHGAVSFHTMKLPVPEDEEEARALLGDEFDVAIGTGPQSVFLCFGKAGLATAKKIIGQSAARENEQLAPSQITIALTPIVNFAKSFSDDEKVQTLAAALIDTAGKDRLQITTTAIDDGYHTRLQVEEGVLQAIGVGVRPLRVWVL